MNRICAIILAAIFFAGVALADTVKGTLEKVDIKGRNITINGITVHIVNDTTIYGEIGMGATHTMTLKDLIPYTNYKISCRYFQRDKAGLVADLIRIDTRN